MHKNQSVTSLLKQKIRQAIHAQNGWIPFDTFMQMALYEPNLGYYNCSESQIGRMPARTISKSQFNTNNSSDFVTAPEISHLFGKTLSRQILQALQHTQTHTIIEFGAGNGSLARDILMNIGKHIHHYLIIDVSSSLRTRQQKNLHRWGHKVQWLASLPDDIEGVLIGNEVLDAMPVKLLAHKNGLWHERGVSVDASAEFIWDDCPTALRPPIQIEGLNCAQMQDFSPDLSEYLTEIHPWAQAFIHTTAQRLKRGCAIWIDYGFGEREYYHSERDMGTLVCHQHHKVDSFPLQAVGQKDITSHVNFTDIAITAQAHDLEILGYTSQGRFLLNCQIDSDLQTAALQERSMALKLLLEHEMGELFKVIMLGKGDFWEPLGFTSGDRTHTL